MFTKGSEHDIIASDGWYAVRSGSNREAKYKQMLCLRSASLLLSHVTFVYLCFSVVTKMCTGEAA